MLKYKKIIISVDTADSERAGCSALSDNEHAQYEFFVEISGI